MRTFSIFTAMFVFICSVIISCTAEIPVVKKDEVTEKSQQAVVVGKPVVREANSVLIGIYCRADDWYCFDHLKEKVEKTMIKAGYKPITKRIDKAAEYPERIESTMDAAARIGAAYVMLMRIEARWMYDFDGEFFSEADGRYSLMDAMDGKVLTTQATGWKKASALGQERSLKAVVDKVFDDLSARIEKGAR